MSEFVDPTRYLGLPVPDDVEAEGLKAFLGFEGASEEAPGYAMDLDEAYEQVCVAWPPLNEARRKDIEAQTDTQINVLTPALQEEFKLGAEYGYKFATLWAVYLNWQRSEIADWQDYLSMASLRNEYPMVGAAAYFRIHQVIDGRVPLDVERQTAILGEDWEMVTFETVVSADLLYRHGLEYLLHSDWFEQLMQGEVESFRRDWLTVPDEATEVPYEEQDMRERVDAYALGFRNGALDLFGMFIESWQARQLEDLEASFNMPAADR